MEKTYSKINYYSAAFQAFVDKTREGFLRKKQFHFCKTVLNIHILNTYLFHLLPTFSEITQVWQCLKIVFVQSDEFTY